MSLMQVSMKRLRPSVAFVIASGLATATVTHAADRSLSHQVTNAFETVVIEATTAAAKATEAAKDALATTPKKAANTSKTTKKAKEDGKSKAADQKSGTDTAKGKDSQKISDKPEASKEGVKDGAQPADTKAGANNNKDAKSANPADAAKDAKDAKKKPAIATEWPAVDIELAKARCTQLLKGVDAVTLPEPPMRKGDCGSPAPVRLVSIGKNPEVALSPPPVVSCDMVVALAKWIKKDVQPLARRHLGSEIITMTSMSDYSCRMAYGRIGNKLSEHGKANALDIRGFMTAKGKTAEVLKDWGPNKRDIAKQIAAAKAAAIKAEAIKTAAEKAALEQATAAADAASPGDVPSAAIAIPRKTLVEGLPKSTDDTSLATPTAVTKETFGMAPTHLGGPKDAGTGLKAAVQTEDEIRPAKSKDKPMSKKERAKAAKKAKEAKDAETAALFPGFVLPERKPLDASGKFLHAVHAAACKIFGTTLGPEANEAHRNHFHVDMAERKHRKICD